LLRCKTPCSTARSPRRLANCRRTTARLMALEPGRSVVLGVPHRRSSSAQIIEPAAAFAPAQPADAPAPGRGGEAVSKFARLVGKLTAKKGSHRGLRAAHRVQHRGARSTAAARWLARPQRGGARHRGEASAARRPRHRAGLVEQREPDLPRNKARARRGPMNAGSSRAPVREMFRARSWSLFDVPGVHPGSGLEDDALLGVCEEHWPL
jgi:hypothetical protein